jgi:hypothetical protein
LISIEYLAAFASGTGGTTGAVGFLQTQGFHDLGCRAKTGETHPEQVGTDKRREPAKILTARLTDMDIP